MKYNLVHTLKIPAADYLALVTSKEYIEWSKEKMKVESKTILENEDSPGTIHQKVKMITKPVSSKTQTLIRQERIEIIETLDADKQALTFVWKVEPDVFKGKVKGLGNGKLRALDADSCERTLDLEVKISIPIIGAIVEKALDSKIGHVFERLNSSMEEFYRDHWKKQC